MPKRTRKPGRRPTDVNQLARYLVDQSTEKTTPGQKAHQLSTEQQEQQTISRIMAEMGRKGGRIGGARRREMSPEKRRELAYRAAKARWANR